MKSVLASLVIALSSGATMAQHYGHHGHGHHGNYHRGGGGYNWVLPAVIGGALMYEIGRQNQPVVIQPPVVVQQYPQPTYRYIQAYDPSCACYKQVIITN